VSTYTSPASNLVTNNALRFALLASSRSAIMRCT
jgi:hypothetical protein